MIRGGLLQKVQHERVQTNNFRSLGSRNRLTDRVFRHRYSQTYWLKYDQIAEYRG
jgi:hypothetical protein